MLLFVIRKTRMCFSKHLKATTNRKKHIYLSNQYIKRRKIGNKRKHKANLMAKHIHFPDNPKLILKMIIKMQTLRMEGRIKIP